MAEVPGLCVICDGVGTIIRPQSAIRRYPELKRIVGVRGLPCPACDAVAFGRAVAAARQAEVDRVLAIANVPPKMRTKTLDDFCDDAAKLKAAGLDVEQVALRKKWKATLRKYLSGLKANLDGNIGLTLCGPPGTGKTLMTGIVANAIAQLPRAVAYVPESGLFQAVRATYGEDSVVGMKDVEVIQRFCSVPVLILDDFGTKRMTDWTTEIYHNIFDARKEAGLPLFISSNLPPAELRRMYFRQMDRAAKNIEIEMVGASLRGTELDR